MPARTLTNGFPELMCRRGTPTDSSRRSPTSNTIATNVNLGNRHVPDDRWNLSAYGSWQWTHGGIDVPIPRTDPLFAFHDRLAADEFFNLGIGTGWSITPSTDGVFDLHAGHQRVQRSQDEPGAYCRPDLRLPAAGRGRRHKYALSAHPRSSRAIRACAAVGAPAPDLCRMASSASHSDSACARTRRSRA